MSHQELPPLELGDQVVDVDNDDDDARVYVLQQTDQTIDEYVIYTTDDGTEQTVHDYHRGDYDPDEPAVEVVYAEGVEEVLPEGGDREKLLQMLVALDVTKLYTDDGWLKRYAFARSRLRRPIETDGEADLPRCYDCEQTVDPNVVAGKVVIDGATVPVCVPCVLDGDPGDGRNAPYSRARPTMHQEAAAPGDCGGVADGD